MDDLDIQTAQLIIQLARDDIYHLDDNALSTNNQDGERLSDLEFALAEQEREFMQYWAEYGHTQINQNAGGPNRRAGGSGNGDNVVIFGGANLVRNGAIASGPIRAGSHPATPISLIDDDDDDIYVNPYSIASSSSSSNDHNRVRSPQPRAATPILLIPVDNDDDDDDVNRHEPAPAASNSSSDRNHNSNSDNRPPNNPFIHAEDPDVDVTTFVTSLFSQRIAPDAQPITSNRIGASASLALPANGVVESPLLDSHTLELLSQLFAIPNGPGSQGASSSSTFHRVQAPSGFQARQAGPSNSIPERTTTAVSTPISPDDPDYAVEMIAEYQATRPIVELDIPQQKAAVINLIQIMSANVDEELSDDEGSIYMPVEPNVECHFCKEVCPISTTINMSCNHRLCRGCISRLIGICIKDETAYPPKCCGNKLQTSELRILDHTLRQQFTTKTREYETPIPARVYCHRCGEFLDSNSSTISTGSSSSSSAVSIHTSRYCDICFVRTCVSCKKASHPSRECQETPDEQALKGLAKQKGWQTCPQCRVVVELSAGCYHVMCRCSAQFCYLCATRWKECSCPAFDEDRLLAMAA